MLADYFLTLTKAGWSQIVFQPRFSLGGLFETDISVASSLCKSLGPTFGSKSNQHQTSTKTVSKGLTHSLSSLIFYGHNSHKSVEKLALAQPYANSGETSVQLYRKAFYRPFRRYNIHQHHTKPSYCICLAFSPIFFCHFEKGKREKLNGSNLLMQS